MEATKLTTAYQQLDPKTGKIITHYGAKSIFTVYVKRYNGRKIVVLMGDGNQIKDILNFYNEYKVYRHDRKYLHHRLVDAPIESDEKVLMENGKGESRIARNTPGRKRIDYKHGELSALKNIPITILKALDAFCNKGYVINAQVMTKTRLVSILLAQFLEQEEKKKLDYLTRGDLLLEKHKLSCGGLSEDRLDKANKLTEEELGEDLL